jgi:F-type H+-transporting ATPase subunit delta
MTQRTAAARYARALIDVAGAELVDLETVGRSLDEFSAFLKAQPALERLLINPAVPVTRKRAAMIELTKLAALPPVVAKLLILLADRDRLTLLADLRAAYAELLAERQQVVRAEVTSIEPLPADRVEAITQRLAALTGKRVSMTTRVDKDIVGGVIARVGSTVYDASIATQLKKIRERLET